ncbi:MAG: hypothetical protein DMD91_06365 [Candidatus Rokuibacteriota bacterium]|nr:MAG: hypothetical protein DMD91_06365 [Candidatus Rokubacteria bacterium]
MIARRSALLLLLALVVVGCAFPAGQGPQPAGRRCANRSAPSTSEPSRDPLFFLFCFESP